MTTNSTTTPTSHLTLGTRGSQLALTQARMTEAALAEQGIDCEIKVVKTIGDKRPDLKLSEFSQGENAVLDKGIFTKELEEALLRGDIDFAVHSLKDVPTELAPEFEIVTTLPRAPIADVMLTTHQQGMVSDLTLLGDRPNPVTIATSSVRPCPTTAMALPKYRGRRYPGKCADSHSQAHGNSRLGCHSSRAGRYRTTRYLSTRRSQFRL